MTDTDELIIKKAARVAIALDIERKTLLDKGMSVAASHIMNYLFDAPVTSKARLYDIIMDIKEN